MLPNLLNLAVKLVGTQQFLYYKYVSRVTNEIGVDNAIYDAPQSVRGQVQAVPRELFEKYGLDFQGTYLMFFISKAILDVQRNVSGDQIKFNNETYQCLSETDWFAINGWTAVIAVRVK